MAIITPTIRIFDNKLMVKDRTILTNVPDNVITTSGAQKMGNRGSEIPMETQFLLVEIKDGFDHLPFRSGASEILTPSPLESSNNNDNNIMYVVFLPLIEDSFRVVLHGNPRKSQHRWFSAKIHHH